MAQDFDEHGYIGSQASDFKRVAREKHRALFDLFEELNSFSQSKKFDIKADNQNGQHVLSLSIFIRILNGAQATYILCERGLTQEAQVIVRSLLEGLLILSKIISEPGFVGIYVSEDEIYRLKLLEAVKKNEHPVFRQTKQTISPDAISTLRGKIRNQKLQPINLADLASDVGLQPYYDSVYRLFSSGVHFRARSLDDYVGLDKEGEITSIDAGPQFKDIPITLGVAMDILVRSLGAMSHLFHLNWDGDIKSFTDKLAQVHSGPEDGDE